MEPKAMIRVLLVDDQTIIRQCLANLLASLPDLLVVGDASNGQQAIEAVCSLHGTPTQHDVILMDVSLAHSLFEGKPVDGIKITQMLKADPVTSDLPVILVTAHAMQGDRESFLAQSGADGYISKPVIDHQKFVDDIAALMPES